MTERRGYAWIALERPKTDSNVGGALRASHVFGASGVILAAPRFAQFRRETRQPPVCSTSSVISEEYPAMNAPKVGHNSAVNATELRSIVERIERLNDEIAERNTDKSEIFKAAKHSGFDTKIVRRVIALRARDAAELQEESELVDLYLGALGGERAA